MAQGPTAEQYLELTRRVERRVLAVGDSASAWQCIADSHLAAAQHCANEAAHWERRAHELEVLCSGLRATLADVTTERDRLAFELDWERVRQRLAEAQRCAEDAEAIRLANGRYRGNADDRPSEREAQLSLCG